MVLELRRALTAATTTKYALFNARLNFAISYVTWADGWAGERVDPAGGLPARAARSRSTSALTFVGIALLLVDGGLVRRRARRSRPDAQRRLTLSDLRGLRGLAGTE